MSGGQEEREYAYWLCRVPGIGNCTIQKLLGAAGNAREVYKGGECLWRQFLNKRQMEAIGQAYRDAEPERAYSELQVKEIRFVMQGDADYPCRLRDIPDPPFALFVKGRLPSDDVPAVSVIGARDCSEYGRYVARELGSALGRSGLQVVSGMARGIDGISQRAALEAGGVSFGVLGSGVDVCYPRENRGLYDRLCDRGGLISVYPPGTAARSQNFPPRNRIVSGLADVLAVIEARSRSGTLITVDMALEQGRDVYVVPGRVTDRLSDGCNRLLKQGAGVFLSPENFLEELFGMKGPAKNDVTDAVAADAGLQARTAGLPEELRRLVGALELQPQSIETIQAKLGEGYAIPRLTAMLIRLCMEDLAVQLTPGYFARSTGI